MKMLRRGSVFVTALTLGASLALAASHVVAAADPNAPPPDPDATGTTQDPNAQPQGTVVLQQGQGGMAVAQPQPQPQPVAVQPQQPPPPEAPVRRSLLIGAAPTFHIPLLGTYASRGAYGGGLNVHVGYAIGNLSLAFAPGVFYYRGASGADEAVFSLGAFVRYTFLRDVIIHPFVEIGLDYWGAINGPGGLSQRDFGIGATGVVGAEYDVTDHISLQLAARVTALAGPQSSTEVWMGDLMLTPFVAFAYYR
jgi:hypothetical protein